MAIVKAEFSVTPEGLGSAGFEVRVLIRAEDGQAWVGKPLMFERASEGGFFPPAMSLTRESTQALMDALYFAGFRPTPLIEGAGKSRVLDATQRHLDDMRVIAMKLLDKSLLVDVERVSVSGDRLGVVDCGVQQC